MFVTSSLLFYILIYRTMWLLSDLSIYSLYIYLWYFMYFSSMDYLHNNFGKLDNYSDISSKVATKIRNMLRHTAITKYISLKHELNSNLTYNSWFNLGSPCQYLIWQVRLNPDLYNLSNSNLTFPTYLTHAECFMPIYVYVYLPNPIITLLIIPLESISISFQKDPYNLKQYHLNILRGHITNVNNNHLTIVVSYQIKPDTPLYSFFFERHLHTTDDIYFLLCNLTWQYCVIWIIFNVILFFHIYTIL